MNFSTVAFLLVMGLAATTLVQGGPVTKASPQEKKSISDEATKEQLDKAEAPKIEDEGDKKDRSKKSAASFCVEIHPGTNQPVQTQCGCNSPAQLVQPAPAPVHTLHIVPAAAPQPIPQLVQQQQQQQQQQQPCQVLPIAPQQQIQPTPAPVQTASPPPPPSAPASTPAPKPDVVQHFDRIIEHIPQPPQIIHVPMPEPSETINIMPVVPPQPAPQAMVFVPSEPLVLVPQQQHEEVEPQSIAPPPPPTPQVAPGPLCNQCQQYHYPRPCSSHYHCPSHPYTECDCDPLARNSGSSGLPFFRSAVQAARMVAMNDRAVMMESSPGNHNSPKNHHKHDRFPMYGYPSTPLSSVGQQSPLMVQCSPRITSLNDNVGTFVRRSEDTETGEAGDMTRPNTLEERRATYINVHSPMSYVPSMDQQQQQLQQLQQQQHQAFYQMIPSGYPYSSYSMLHPNSHHVVPSTGVASLNAYPQVNYANAFLHQLYPGQPSPVFNKITSPSYQQPIYSGKPLEFAKKEHQQRYQASPDMVGLSKLHNEDSRKSTTTTMNGQKQAREVPSSSSTLLTAESRNEEKIAVEDGQTMKSETRVARSDKGTTSKDTRKDDKMVENNDELKTVVTAA